MIRSPPPGGGGDPHGMWHKHQRQQRHSRGRGTAVAHTHTHAYACALKAPLPAAPLQRPAPAHAAPATALHSGDRPWAALLPCHLPLNRPCCCLFASEQTAFGGWGGAGLWRTSEGGRVRPSPFLRPGFSTARTEPSLGLVTAGNQAVWPGEWTALDTPFPFIVP